MLTIYSHQDFQNIIFDGFQFSLPEETIILINELASKVGAPTYIKTPVFKKKEVAISKLATANASETWEKVQVHSFKTTKIEQKKGIDSKIDMIRFHLNKITDKKYIDCHNKIVDLLNELIENNITDEDLMRICLHIFEIASNNRFYSKLYADLYSDLITRYDIMKTIFNNSFNSFMELFNHVEYVDPAVNYDAFCKNNKDNECRKSLSTFILNLMNNNIISREKVMSLLSQLLAQVQEFILLENKKNEVDELTENIALLFKAELVAEITIDGVSFMTILKNLAKSKMKSYPSLSNKSIFKYMDLCEM
jgi:hypothetical protein